MASQTYFQQFYEDLANGVHDLFGTTHTVKVVLTNTAPTASTDAVLADITQISAGNGYTTGGEDLQNDGTRSGGTVTVTGVDITWTASGGTIGPFRYAVAYNDTPTSPADPLISYVDYGSSITLNAGETFKYDVGASWLTVS